MSSFVGRSAELASLLELVRTGRLVTVTGPGGVGKTRMVVEALPLLQELFDGRVRTTSLAGLGSASGTRGVAARLDTRSPEALAVELGSAPSLMVLHECEEIAVGAAEFIARYLAATEVGCVLATSRTPLLLAEEERLVLSPLDLPSVTDPDAAETPVVQLLLSRARAAGASAVGDSESSLRAVVELCRRLDGLPLAVELAAARLGVVSPSEMISLLEDREAVLTSRLRDAPERHRSVSAAMEVSVDALSELARVTLRRVSIIGGGFGLSTAHMVVSPGGDLSATLDGLSELVECSLLVAVPAGDATSYRLLDLVRDHAQGDLLRAGEYDATHELLVDALLGDALDLVAQGSHLWSAEVLSRVTSLVDALIRGIEWCLANDSGPERAFLLMCPLFGAAHQSRNADICAVGDQVMQRWSNDDAPWRGEALAVLSTAYAMAGAEARAEALAAAALEATDSSPLAAVMAGRARGLAAFGGGDLSAAQQHMSDARAAAAASLLRPFDRELRAFEALLLGLAGDPARGLEIARAAVEQSDLAHDPLNEIWALVAESVLTARLENWEAVRGCVARARQVADAAALGGSGLSIFWSRAHLLAHDATAVTMLHGWEAALDSWAAALDLAIASGELAEVALTLRAACAAALRGGETAAAQVFADAVPSVDELDIVPVPAALDDVVEGLQITRSSARAEDIAPSLRRVRQMLASAGRPSASVVEEAPAPRATLERDGDGWSFTFRGESGHLRSLKGIADLARLLDRPGVEHHCLDLVGARFSESGTGPAIDNQARQEYQQRILELQGEAEEARDCNDLGRAERAERELDALVEQLSAAFGLGGRDRDSQATVQRARTAVTNRIRAAIGRIGEVHRPLGRHLASSVRTGTWCAYEPEVPVTWSVVDS